MDPKYPFIHVQLTGQDSNAFMIIGLVNRALHKAGVPQSEIDEFGKEATSGDFGNVIATAMRWVTVS